MLRRILFSLIGAAILCSCSGKKTTQDNAKNSADSNEPSLLFAGEERHFQNVRQLTFGGRNVESYFSQDGKWLIFQSRESGDACDQLYVMRTDGTDRRRISPGDGRSTRGFFAQTGASIEESQIVYSSTHDHQTDCPRAADASLGIVWPLLASYEIYVDGFRGGNLRRLTNNNFFDAEASVSPDGKEIVFTSNRSGDLDIYIMNMDGTNVRRLTHSFGYDGGAIFSKDGKQILYRAYHPTLNKERQQYTQLLKKGYFRPAALELFIMDRNGSNRRRITDLKAASFTPYLFPNNQRVIFSSNLADPRRKIFDLFAVNTSGGFLEKLTFNRGFDSFPMFSFDGQKVIWSSNRNAKNSDETNLFIADWVD